jgi:DNA-binding beta-propeller fold protein YncE
MKTMKSLWIAACIAVAPALAADLKAGAETVAKGFVFPESVGCDPAGKYIYVGNFGGTELKPAEKDGKGYISRATADGKVVDERFLPAQGETMNKPKGIWVTANRLWVTDIDGVWIFDLKTRKSRKLMLPGVTFANDPALVGNALYVTDNRSDQLVKVEPADFLDASVDPKVSVVFSGRSVSPNGIYPGDKGDVLVVGFVSPDSPRAIFKVGKDGEPVPVSTPIGRLDGLYRMKDGTLLVTDWNSGALFSWKGEGTKQDLATGFKGPADFCVMPKGAGFTVYVPDLVKSEVRIIPLSR